MFFQPSVIGKEANGIHDTSLPFFMEGGVATRKKLYPIVVLPVGTTMFKGFLGTHDEGIDGVGSIHGEIKGGYSESVWIGGFVLSSLSLQRIFDLAGRVR